MQQKKKKNREILEENLMQSAKKKKSASWEKIWGKEGEELCIVRLCKPPDGLREDMQIYLTSLFISKCTHACMQTPINVLQMPPVEKFPFQLLLINFLKATELHAD